MLRIFLCIVIACICITSVYYINLLEVVEVDNKLYSNWKENLYTLFYKPSVKEDAEKIDYPPIAVNHLGINNHHKEVKNYIFLSKAPLLRCNLRIAFVTIRQNLLNRRDDVVVRASALQSVDLGFISQVDSYQKT